MEMPDVRFVNLLKRDFFVVNVEKRSFYFNHSFDCDSQGVVYLIICKRCGKQCGEQDNTIQVKVH